MESSSPGVFIWLWGFWLFFSLYFDRTAVRGGQERGPERGEEAQQRAKAPPLIFKWIIQLKKRAATISRLINPSDGIRNYFYHRLTLSSSCSVMILCCFPSSSLIVNLMFWVFGAVFQTSHDIWRHHLRPWETQTKHVILKIIGRLIDKDIN